MAWKTLAGHVLKEGDRVVWLEADGNPVMQYKGTVLECLPVNDEDDGEIRIAWDNNNCPVEAKRGKRIRWYYPMWVERLDAINACDRIADALNVPDNVVKDHNRSKVVE